MLILAYTRFRQLRRIKVKSNFELDPSLDSVLEAAEQFSWKWVI